MRARLAVVLALASISILAAAPARAQAPAPWLGVGIEHGPRGVRVSEVVTGAPAAVAGLRAGDQIAAVGEHATPTPNDLVRVIARYEIGDAVELSLLRDDRPLKLIVHLAARLDDDELLQRRLVDRAAPAFELPVVAAGGSKPRVSGKLADHRGKVVVIDFVATWCHPCKSTYGPLAALAAAHPTDLVVLGMASEPAAAVRAYATRERLAFPVLVDDGATTRRRYRVSKTPTLVVIGKDGVVRYAGIGGGLELDHAIFAAEQALRETP